MKAPVTDVYTVRFGIETLMSFFLDDDFNPKFLKWVAKIRSEEYYLNMMVAWFFATALAKQYEATLPFIEKRVLDVWTHNKTIQKAIESYRITDEQKAYHDEKFIKTFITVKNSVFKDAGLFAIGMDSHFAGPALANGPELVKSLGAIGNLFKKNNGTLVDEWIGLAKTSYGAKLTFDGDVQLCSWKDLENVDSSTLISVPEKSVFSGKIDFDVNEILEVMKIRDALLISKENIGKWIEI
jgi:hypothetical protein